MKRPTRIKILGKVYDVDYVPEGTKGLEGDDCGICDSEKLYIAVKDGQPLQNEQDTLLHECLHAITHQMDVEKYLGKYEEKIVRTLATGLLAVIKDNPGSLLSYLKARRCRNP